MESTLFRKAALERLSSPEQLDTIARLTEPRTWLALIGATGQKKVKLAHSQTANGNFPLAYDLSNELM